MAYYMWADDDLNLLGADIGSNLMTLGLYFGYNITPSVAFKGLYYYQSLGDWEEIMMLGEDNASAWKVAIDVDQDALKFTSLWLEYAQIDNAFVSSRFSGDSGFFYGPGNNPYTFNGASLLNNQPVGGTETTKVYGFRANQRWNDKWRTFLGYYTADFDTAGLDDPKEWTVGFGYQLNPAVEFELAYDNIDYGDNNFGDDLYGNPVRNGDDHQIRFRTFVSF
jgi:hypothetical protein